MDGKGYLNTTGFAVLRFVANDFNPEKIQSFLLSIPLQTQRADGGWLYNLIL
jgi:hypothetical protein